MVIIQVFGQHARAWLSERRVFGRKRPVDMYGVEMYAFIGKTKHYKFLYRPELIFRKTRRSQTILVGNHYKFIFQFPGNSSHVLKYTRIKFQFTEIINLVTGRRFFDQRTVPVNKKDPFHINYLS